ncbi:MAG: peptidoglycan DD-metalloendopeptidase family protein [Candidatus Nomurabacteria bacterium]|nr:peptidoglycan DD-metalloendopeptidase family protein [Candidatus Nomurabacteria bacterium]
MKNTQFKTALAIFALFVLFGVVFVSTRTANASFISSLGLNTEVFASDSVSDNTNSSQNTALESKISPMSIVTDSKDKNSVKLGEEVNINNNSLVPNTSAMGQNSDQADTSADEIGVYVVRKGDKIADIAKMFDISVNTIDWANERKKGAPLVEGELLLIPPVSGVIHVVAKNQTLKGIAKLYGVDIEDITSFNDIGDKGILVGDELVIPGAEVPNSVSQSKKVKQGGRLPSNKNKSQMRSSEGYFVNPLPGCDTTQGIHDGTAVDLSCHVAGTPIHAAAAGRVIFARYGKNGGFGNLVIISHPNGMQTYYAHQSKLNVSIGDNVYQGQVIGFVGNTGHSFGNHLHFEVRGGWNPGWDKSWAKN